MAPGQDKEKEEARVENGSPAPAAGPTPFEEAVALTGHGRFHLILLSVCGWCLISMIFESLAAAYVTPAAQCDFEMTSFEKGFLGGTIYIGMIVSSHMWGFVADTRGRRLVLLLTLALDFLCSVVAALMPSLSLLIFVRFLNGVWICGPSAVTYAYLGEFHAYKTRTQSMVYACIFIAFAVIAQPGLAWLVIPQPWAVPLGGIVMRSWRVFLILGAVPSAITFLGLYFLLPESPKFLLAIGRHDEALNVLRRMFAANSGLPPDKYPVTALEVDPVSSSSSGLDTKSPLAIMRHMWRQTAPLFKPPYLLYTLLACIIQFGLYASCNGFLIWLPELLNRVGKFRDAYPGHEATVCDVIAVMAGQMQPPMPMEATLPETYSEFPDTLASKGTVPGAGVATLVTETLAAVVDNGSWAAQDWLSGNSTWAAEGLSQEWLPGNSSWLAEGLSQEWLPGNSSWLAEGLSQEWLSGNSSWLAEGLSQEWLSGNSSWPADASPCVATVSVASFQNSLITGAGSAVAYISISFIIRLVSKKTIITVSLAVSGVCGVCTIWAQTELQILMLPLAFMVLSGMCISVVNTVVVDSFPTYLRAMAVCLSLCCGRLGTFVTSLMLGALIDSSCVLAIAILGGFVFVCGVLSMLLPSEAKMKELRH